MTEGSNDTPQGDEPRPPAWHTQAKTEKKEAVERLKIAERNLENANQRLVDLKQLLGSFQKKREDVQVGTSSLDQDSIQLQFQSAEVEQLEQHLKTQKEELDQQIPLQELEGRVRKVKALKSLVEQQAQEYEDLKKEIAELQPVVEKINSAPPLEERYPMPNTWARAELQTPDHEDRYSLRDESPSRDYGARARERTHSSPRRSETDSEPHYQYTRSVTPNAVPRLQRRSETSYAEWAQPRTDRSESPQYHQRIYAGVPLSTNADPIHAPVRVAPPPRSREGGPPPQEGEHTPASVRRDGRDLPPSPQKRLYPFQGQLAEVQPPPRATQSFAERSRTPSRPKERPPQSNQLHPIPMTITAHQFRPSSSPPQPERPPSHTLHTGQREARWDGPPDRNPPSPSPPPREGPSVDHFRRSPLARPPPTHTTPSASPAEAPLLPPAMQGRSAQRTAPSVTSPPRPRTPSPLRGAVRSTPSYWDKTPISPFTQSRPTGRSSPKSWRGVEEKGHTNLSANRRHSAWRSGSQRLHSTTTSGWSSPSRTPSPNHSPVRQTLNSMQRDVGLPPNLRARVEPHSATQPPGLNSVGGRRDIPLAKSHQGQRVSPRKERIPGVSIPRSSSPLGQRVTSPSRSNDMSLIWPSKSATIVRGINVAKRQQHTAATMEVPHLGRRGGDGGSRPSSPSRYDIPPSHHMLSHEAVSPNSSRGTPYHRLKFDDFDVLSTRAERRYGSFDSDGISPNYSVGSYHAGANKEKRHFENEYTTQREMWDQYTRGVHSSADEVLNRWLTR